LTTINQLTQYERELTKNEGKKKALSHSVQSNNLRIQMAENRIAESQAQINRIKKERSAIFKQKRAHLKEFFGVQPTHKFRAENGDACPSVKPSYTQTDYLKQATKTRQMLQQQKIDSVQQLLVCVTGVETIPDTIKPLIDLSVKCPNNLKIKKKQIEFAKKIALKEEKRADAQLAKMRTHITKLQSHIKKVLKLLKTIKDIKQKYEKIVTVAQKAYEIASAFPNIIAGMGAGTEFDPSKIAKAAYEGAKNALDRVLKWAESEGSLDEKALQLTGALEKLKGQMTLKKVEADIRQSQVLRTVQEIYGKGMQQAHDIQELLMQKQEIVQDAQFEKSRLKANIAATQSEHRKRLLEWGLAGQRNDQLQFAIGTQKREIEKQRLQIEIIKHQTQELETQLSVLERDIQSIETLKAYSTASIEKIQQLASDLSGLEQEVSAQEAALKRLNKEELQKIIAVEGIELGYVEAVIKQEKSQTDQLKQTIDQLISIGQQQTQLSLEEIQLTQDMLAYQKDISSQIQAEREIIMNNLQESKGAGAKKEKLFIATQADIATLLKGVPTLIHNKRRLMESANRYLNLLRNRIKANKKLAETSLDRAKVAVKVLKQESDEVVKLYETLKAHYDEKVNTMVTRLVSDYKKAYSVGKSIIDRYAQWQQQGLLRDKNRDLSLALIGASDQYGKDGVNGIVRAQSEAMDKMLADAQKIPELIKELQQNALETRNRALQLCQIYYCEMGKAGFLRYDVLLKACQPDEMRANPLCQIGEASFNVSQFCQEEVGFKFAKMQMNDEESERCFEE